MVNIRDLIILLKEEFPNNSIITIAKVRKLEKKIKVIHPKYKKHLGRYKWAEILNNAAV